MKKTMIVVFAFGAPDTILSNRRISQIASQKARELNAHVYSQNDIKVESGIKVKYMNEGLGNPPTTLRLAREAVQWAERHRFTEMWIVAAKPHLWRALRDVRQSVHEYGARRIEIRVCKEVEQYPEDSWFCSDSMQNWTRSRKAWGKREKILKLMPFFMYKCVVNCHS